MSKYHKAVKNDVTNAPELDLDALRHQALANPLRLRLLRVLAEAGPFDAHALAAQLAVRPNAVRRHLDQLVRAGLVSAAPERPGRPGRPRLRYRIGPAEASERLGYPLLADMLAASLLRLADTGVLEAEGRLWGRRLVGPSPSPVRLDADAARVKLLQMLDRLGFEPAVDQTPGDGIRIDLHRCPFFATAKVFPGVVCALHLGLMQGALAELGTALEAERLDPLVEPTRCVAHLRTTT